MVKKNQQQNGQTRGKKWEDVYYEIAAGDMEKECAGDVKTKKAVEFVLENAKPGDKILEVGCGVAGLASVLGDKSFYYGTDVSDYALNAAREKFSGKKNIVLVKSRAEKLPFGDGEFNFVFSKFSLEHLDQPKESLLEMARVLKSGGFLIVIAPNLEFPLSYPTALRHKGFLFKIGFIIMRFFDYFKRVFGFYSFRILRENYLMATGEYKKKDDDLVYLVSSYEVVGLLKEKGFEFVFINKLGLLEKSEKNFKCMFRKIISFFPAMKYSGVELFIIAKKK